MVESCGCPKALAGVVVAGVEWCGVPDLTQLSGVSRMSGCGYWVVMQEKCHG